MAENTKPADDNNDETPEVEAHSVLDLQETSVDREIEAPGKLRECDQRRHGGLTGHTAAVPRRLRRSSRRGAPSAGDVGRFRLDGTAPPSLPARFRLGSLPRVLPPPLRARAGSAPLSTTPTITGSSS